MKRTSLGARLALSTLLTVTALMLLFGVLAWFLVSAQMERQAADEAAQQTELVLTRLGTIAPAHPRSGGDRHEDSAAGGRAHRSGLDYRHCRSRRKDRSRPASRQRVRSVELCDGRSCKVSGGWLGHALCLGRRQLHPRDHQRDETGWIAGSRNGAGCQGKGLCRAHCGPLIQWRGGHSGRTLHHQLRSDAGCPGQAGRRLVHRLPVGLD